MKVSSFARVARYGKGLCRFAGRAFILSLVTAMSMSASGMQMGTAREITPISIQRSLWLPGADYAELSRILQYLVKEYPPDQYLYVGMGRSPTPLIALAKAALGESRALSLPLSHIGNRIYFPSKEEEDYMDKHFRHFLPTVKELKGRKILLIDFALNGRSIIEGLRQLRRYYGTKAGVYALGMSGSEVTIKILTHMQITTIALSARLDQRYLRRVYSPYAEFERFFTNIPSSRYEAPERREQFDQLKNAMARRMILDLGLRQTLEKHFDQAELLKASALTCALRLLSGA